MELGYLNFDLTLESDGSGRYTAKVVSSPAGEAENDFHWPFSEQDLEIFVLRIGQTRRGTRRSGSPEMEHARDFGRRLYQAVFGEQVHTCLMRSLDEAERHSRGLRLRFRTNDVPELADTPWEFLYVDDLRRFLVVSTETPIVRYLDLPRPIRPLSVAPPLQILGVVSNPSDIADLDVEQEWHRLQTAVGDLERDGLVRLVRLQRATLDGLQSRLRQGDIHVFHFIGHGGFERASNDGVLYFEDEAGRAREVTSESLGTVLHDHRSLRLAVLNSCEGARSSSSDPFSGTAAGLVAQGIPAVVAMQFEITDMAAIDFAHEFYRSIADRYPIDAAVSEARKKLYTVGNDVEWGTPVLHMRTPDGQIFDIKALAPASTKADRPEPRVGGVKVDELLERAREAVAAGDAITAGRHLRHVLEIDSLHEEAWAMLERVDAGSNATSRTRRIPAVSETFPSVPDVSVASTERASGEATAAGSSGGQAVPPPSPRSQPALSGRMVFDPEPWLNTRTIAAIVGVVFMLLAVATTAIWTTRETGQTAIGIASVEEATTTEVSTTSVETTGATTSSTTTIVEPEKIELALPPQIVEGPIDIAEAGVMLLQGVPGAELDIYANGKAVAVGLETRQLAGPLDLQPGSISLVVYAALTAPPASAEHRTDTPLHSQILSLGAEPTTIAVHLDHDGNRSITGFIEPLEPIESGKTRIVVRNLLQRPGSSAVDIVVVVRTLVPDGDYRSPSVNPGSVKYEEQLVLDTNVMYQVPNRNFSVGVGAQGGDGIAGSGWIQGFPGDLITATAIGFSGDGTAEMIIQYTKSLEQN